ncbi:MAG TPA: hypothetical protein VKT49_04590, partial [Bryobacteraceae bacterium]|nr:hypothetical protein [Bryobacteraceae bacterium]
MNWKLVTAFAAGAIIASGIVYVSVKGIPEEKPVAAQPVVAQVEAPQPGPIPGARVAKPSAPAGPDPVPA